jgi:hypothetical protein
MSMIALKCPDIEVVVLDINEERIKVRVRWQPCVLRTACSLDFSSPAVLLAATM